MESGFVVYQLSPEEVSRAVKYAGKGDKIVENLIVEAIKGYLSGARIHYLRHSTIELENLSAKIEVTVFEPYSGEIKEMVFDGRIFGNNSVELRYVFLTP